MKTLLHRSVHHQRRWEIDSGFAMVRREADLQQQFYYIPSFFLCFLITRLAAGIWKWHPSATPAEPGAAQFGSPNPSIMQPTEN